MKVARRGGPHRPGRSRPAPPPARAPRCPPARARAAPARRWPQRRPSAAPSRAGAARRAGAGGPRLGAERAQHPEQGGRGARGGAVAQRCQRRGAGHGGLLADPDQRGGRDPRDRGRVVAEQARQRSHRPRSPSWPERRDGLGLQVAAGIARLPDQRLQRRRAAEPGEQRQRRDPAEGALHLQGRRRRLAQRGHRGRRQSTDSSTKGRRRSSSASRSMAPTASAAPSQPSTASAPTATAPSSTDERLDAGLVRSPRGPPSRTAAARAWSSAERACASAGSRSRPAPPRGRHGRSRRGPAPAVAPPPARR